MQKIKKNILKPFLLVCLGLALTTITFARMGNRKPSPPGRPEATNINRFGCTLTYLAPQDWGGAVITRYYIEVQETWERRWTLHGDTGYLQYDVISVKNNVEYQFRVLAENAAGLSDPSIPCKPIEFSDPF